jgi:predicted phage terminase large subunit-like protein
LEGLRQILHNPTATTQTKIEALYILCYFDFKLFVQTFFQSHCQYPFSAMHEDLFALESDPKRRGRRLAIAAPRGHAKTTFLVHFKVLHALVYGTEKFILILGHSETEANAKVAELFHELENNLLLKAVYGQLAPKPGQPGCSRKNFVTQNNIRVMAKSRGKQVRGLKHGCHRPTLIILDDIEAPDSVLQEEQRYKTQQWFEKDILKLGSVDGQANVVIIGTCIHPESLLSNLLTAPGWEGYKYQAVLSFATNQQHWKMWEAIYLDLTNPDRDSDADRYYQRNVDEMMEGTSVLWPAAEPYVQLMKMILNEGQASFQSEKQNDPFDPTRQIFQMEKAKRFIPKFDSQGELEGFQWLDESHRFIPRHQIARIIAFHDPALCEGRDSDYAAIVVCAADHFGYLYCLDAYIEKVPPSRQIQQAVAFYHHWGLDYLCIETNHFQSLLKDQYRLIQDEQTFFRIKEVNHHTPKTSRIATLEPLITNGQLLFHRDINPRLITQLQLFPTSHDDGPDALHGAVTQLHPYAKRKKPLASKGQLKSPE